MNESSSDEQWKAAIWNSNDCPAYDHEDAGQKDDSLATKHASQTSSENWTNYLTDVNDTCCNKKDCRYIFSVNFLNANYHSVKLKAEK